jgi:aldose 1-epimerase
VRGRRAGQRDGDRTPDLRELSNGPARVVIDPAHGGRIQQLTVDGLDLLVPPTVNDHNYGSFPMAPWAGRIRLGHFVFDGVEHELPINKPPHAIHGTVRDRRWNVDRETRTDATWSTALEDPWPFYGRVVQHATLTPTELALTMEVHAAGAEFPASCGWHPWWSRELVRGEPLEIELHAARMYQRDDDGIPNGELVPVRPPPWDDCFTELHPPAAILRWPDAATVTIETDCSCVVVFTEPEHAMCVEPQSGPPDALNIEPRLVTPDEPLVVQTAWRWQIG